LRVGQVWLIHSAACSSTSLVTFTLDHLSVISCLDDSNKWPIWCNDVFAKLIPPVDITHLLSVLQPSSSSSSSSSKLAAATAAMARPTDVISCRGLILSKSFRASLESEVKNGQTEKWCISLRDLSGPDHVDLYIPIRHHCRPMLLIPGAIIWIMRARRRVSRERWKIYLDCHDDTCITVMSCNHVPLPFATRPSSSSSSTRALHWGGITPAPVDTFPRTPQHLRHNNGDSNNRSGDVPSTLPDYQPLPVTYLAQLSPWPDAIHLSLLRIKCRIIGVAGINLQVVCVICNEVLTDKRCRSHPGGHTQLRAEARVDVDDGTAVATAYLKSDALAAVMTHAGWYISVIIYLLSRS
jgi:hypothetical protein